MMQEAQVIQEIIAGVDRYGELVERYHVGLIIHCEHLIGDRDEAEDIAQETFVKAYLQLERYDPQRARFSTWLYKIANNVAIDHLRKQRRQIKVDDIELIAEATMPTYLLDEAARDVRTAVAGLQPPEYRTVIEAYYWHGKSYQEISQECQKPINTIRTWMRRAKLQLKEKLL